MPPNCRAVDVNSSADFDRCLNEQLKRLQTDRIDFYLLHGLDKVEWPKVRNLGVLKWAEGAIADGRFRYFGFSFHDTYDVFQEIIDSYDNWTLCQIQYNYMDEEFQAGTRGLEYAHKKGLAVVVMEPIKGGRLTRPPEKVAKIWANAPVKRTPSGVGIALGLESSGSDISSQRYEHNGAGSRKCRCR